MRAKICTLTHAHDSSRNTSTALLFIFANIYTCVGNAAEAVSHSESRLVTDEMFDLGSVFLFVRVSR